VPSERVPFDPAVAWVDLPPGGAWAALDERLRALTGHTRVVVVRASGARRAAGEETAGASAGDIAARERVIERLSSPDAVFVAVVEGLCDGAGLAIALGCDLVLAADGAEFVFSSPELFGVVASLGAAVGRVRALELCLTGRRLPAAEAASFGLVNLVVGGGEVVDAVDDLTAAILGTPRDLAAELKRALRAASSDKVSRSEELAAIVRLTGDDDARRER